jgi:hypothetical protein
MPTPSDLRDGVDGLTAFAAADLRDLWRQVTTADQARDALLDVLPNLIQTYALASATVAADWYDDLRDELNVEGRFLAIVSEIEDQGVDTLARWGVAPLFDSVPDWKRAQTLIEGGLQLRVANAARETVRLSSIEDPKAQGWQRSASAGCSFCRMLAARGAVYSERTVDFAAHDHCRCHAVPVFTGRPKLVQPYTPSDRNITDADRARVRGYLASHDAG